VKRNNRTRITIVIALFLILSGITLFEVHSLHRERYEAAVIFTTYGFVWIGMLILNRKKSGR
jgi:hypothetical protein